ncbi:MAG TPA: metallophosphoesterase [Candidatus Choladousia intestinavium]|uniref:Metallophosphoesterase n=1 Tax=Candidatus Choladousia intestinavium TaxID=2840727 RepID=A0A9D1DBF5_9FIRM|nr:metallophosphoesterase [Candidatus Choladousia intestinavium]
MKDIKVARYKVRAGQKENRPVHPFTIVFLSDLHNAGYGEGNGRLLAEIRNQSPQAVFVAGDMVTAEENVGMNQALSLLDGLTKQYPVFYANGNHECRLKNHPEKYGDLYEKYSASIKSLGVHLLENACEKIELERMSLAVWGYELPSEYFKRGGLKELKADQIRETLGEPLPECFNLLLAHHPEYFPVYAKWGADLTLSGHLHGGIVRLPGVGGVISPRFGLFPAFDRGLYARNEKRMIVSAGLGTHTIPIRINNPPELVVIDIM